jgi:uncharacterized protein (DUF58 family)
MGVALFGIGRTTGAGWMVVICSGLVGLLVVAMAWPLTALRGLHVDVVAPADGTVGRPLSLTLSLTARTGRRGVAVRTQKPESTWMRADVPSEGELIAVPMRRGVYDEVRVEIRCAAPLALVSLRRTFTPKLVRPLEVGPHPIPLAPPRAAAIGAPGGEPQPFARSGHDLVRSLREYVPGDSARLVHWPGTARRGDLMVKEMEEPDRPRVAVVVDLRGPADKAEEAASRAAGLAGEVLRGGLSLYLLTAEKMGGAVAVVHTAREAGRRLARAVALAPPEGPLPPGSHVVRIGVEP